MSFFSGLLLLPFRRGHLTALALTQLGELERPEQLLSKWPGVACSRITRPQPQRIVTAGEILSEPRKGFSRLHAHVNFA